MSIVCIDTQILFWAVVGKPVPGSEKLIQPAKDFMQWLDNQKHTIIIPSIVVGEMLIPVDDVLATKTLALFQSDWIIVDYDLRAAYIFSRMRRDHIEKKRYEDIRKININITKKELLADAMIIATAIANNADILYSHNKDLRQLAEGWIVAKDFMDEQFQRSLPDSE